MPYVISSYECSLMCWAARWRPPHVMLQRYHSGFQDFVDISEEEILEAGDKLKAIVKDCHKDKVNANFFHVGLYIEDITRPRKDMNFIFEW